MDSSRQSPNESKDPLGMVTAMKVSSSTDALAVMDDIEDMLNNKNDWEVRCQGLKSAMMYLKGNINKFPGCDFTILSTGIANCVLDSRTTLVRWATLLITACAVELKSGFANSSDILIQSLFKQIPNGTQFISKSCASALKSIYMYVTHRRVARSFLTASSNKSPASRLIVVQALEYITKNWPTKIVQGLQQNIDHVFSQLYTDPSPDVRKAAGKIKPVQENQISTPRSPFSRSSYKPEAKPKKGILKTPNRAPSASPSRIPIPVKYKSSSSSPYEAKMRRRVSFVKNDENRFDDLSENEYRENQESTAIKDEEEITIDELMPPTSVKVTTQFLNMLEEIIQTDQISKLEGLEELIPESIIIGSRYVSQYSMWSYCLEYLIPKYSNEFKYKILELISVFSFDMNLLEIVNDVYTIAEIAQLYINAPTGFRNDSVVFFHNCVQQFHGFVPNDSIIQYLKSISDIIPEKYEKSIQVLLSYEININTSLIDNIMKYITENTWESQLNSILNQIYNMTPAELTNFEEQFAILWDDTIAQGKTVIIDNFTRFLVNIVPKLDVMSFAMLVNSLFILIGSESLVNQQKYIELLVQFIGNEETLKFILDIVAQYIEKKDLDSPNLTHIMNSILKYFQTHDEEKVIELMDIICSYIIPILKSSCTSTRRCIIMILSIFYRVAPARFSPYFESLGTPQQRLIVMYSQK